MALKSTKTTVPDRIRKGWESYKVQQDNWCFGYQYIEDNRTGGVYVRHEDRQSNVFFFKSGWPKPWQFYILERFPYIIRLDNEYSLQLAREYYNLAVKNRSKEQKMLDISNIQDHLNEKHAALANDLASKRTELKECDRKIEALRAARESAELEGTKSRELIDLLRKENTELKSSKQIIDLLRKENTELKSSVAHFKRCHVDAKDQISLLQASLNSMRKVPELLARIFEQLELLPTLRMDMAKLQQKVLHQEVQTKAKGEINLTMLARRILQEELVGMIESVTRAHKPGDPGLKNRQINSNKFSEALGEHLLTTLPDGAYTLMELVRLIENKTGDSFLWKLKAAGTHVKTTQKTQQGVGKESSSSSTRTLRGFKLEKIVEHLNTFGANITEYSGEDKPTLVYTLGETLIKNKHPLVLEAWQLQEPIVLTWIIEKNSMYRLHGEFTMDYYRRANATLHKDSLSWNRR